MIGPGGASGILATRLSGRLPAKTEELRDRFTLEPEAFADVTQVIAGQAPQDLGIEDWPLLEVTNAGDGPWEPDPDGEPGVERTWIVPYQLVIWAWVRGDGYADTYRRRQLLVLAVMEILAELLVLSGDPPVRLDDQTIATDYSGVELDEETRFLAGARIRVTVKATESLSAAVADVDVIRVDTGSIPQGAG